MVITSARVALLCFGLCVVLFHMQPCTSEELVSFHSSLPRPTLNVQSRSAAYGKETPLAVSSLTPSQASGFLHQFRTQPKSAGVSAGSSRRRSVQGCSKSRRVSAGTEGEEDAEEADASLPDGLLSWSLRGVPASVHKFSSVADFDSQLMSSVTVLDTLTLLTTRRGQLVSKPGVSPRVYENLELSEEPLSLHKLLPSGTSGASFNVLCESHRLHVL